MSYLHVGKYQNNYHQSIERTRGNVVQKMIITTSGYQLWFSHSKLQQMIESQIVYPYIILMYGVLSFPWKHNTLLAVYCTLLNKYIFKENDNTKKQEKKERRKKELCRTRTQHPWLGAKLEFAYPLCCGVEEQMLIFSSSLTPE